MNYRQVDLKLRRIAVLIPLLVALLAFATSTPTLINVTEWYVQSQAPPIKKYAGVDAINNPDLVTVDWYTASDGTNVTRVIITGFKGDITKYDSVLIIKNEDPSYTYSVVIKYIGLVSGYNWDYVAYIKLIVKKGATTQELYIDSTSSSGLATSPISLAPGEQIEIGAEVLVKADAPTGSTVIGITVHVEASRS